MKFRSRSDSFSTTSYWFDRYDLYLVDIIEEDIFFTAALAPKDVDIVTHDATRVAISRSWYLSKLLAFDPSEKFRLLLSINLLIILLLLIWIEIRLC